MKNEIETLKDDLIARVQDYNNGWRCSSLILRAYYAGDVPLLRAYDRLISRTVSAEVVSNLYSLVSRFSTVSMVSRLKEPHVEAYVTAMKVLYLRHMGATGGGLIKPNVNDDLHQMTGWLAVCHPHRVDEITAILNDRGVSDPATLVSLFTEMGNHHSSLSEGAL